MEVYRIARDLNKVPVGRHQFIAIITGKGPAAFFLKKSNITLVSQLLGKEYGLVLGAHNVNPKEQKKPAKFNRLIFKPFERADLAAAKEFFTSVVGKHALWENYNPAQGKKIIPHKGISEAKFVRDIIDAIDLYIVNERSSNIPYPTPWFGKNSNSWVSSLLSAVQADIIKGGDDFTGADAGHDVQIDKDYFKGICSPCQIQNSAYR
ncbi:MAG: hypothetical protein ACJAS1_005100 [Oleiphilaceae bacterium]